MHLDFGSDLPIYQQITRSIEDDIVLGVLPEEGQIPSTTEISVGYKVNPATVAKGYNLLVEQGILNWDLRAVSAVLVHCGIRDFRTTAGNRLKRNCRKRKCG